MTADDLLTIISNNNIFFSDKEDVRESIQNAIDRGNIIHILRGGQWLGFVTWSEVYKHGHQYIYLNNLFIRKSEENIRNLLFLRNILRQKYPFCDFFYWHSLKKDKFYYIK